MPGSVNIAILGRGFVNWGGGVDLLRILINGLTAVERDGSSPIHVLLPRDNWKSRLIGKLFSSSPRATEPQLRSSFATYGNKVEVRFFDDTTSGLLKSLRAVRADIVLPCMHSLGAHYPIPWIGYLLDFQHMHLPHLFSRWNRVYRRYTFTAMLREARTILVNARAVEVDAAQFYPDSKARITPLPFTPSVRKEWLTVDPDRTRRRFAIPERYFIVCNQFWVHKDHRTAFRAFATLLHALPQSERSIALVCTGSMHDYRAPHHMGQLRGLLDELAITESVHLLGHIAKEEQIALLRGAIAVVQPTLFEGGPGGGAIYDAVALGVPSIVSDIPVNREIDDDGVRYFPPEHPDELARSMLEAMRQPRAVIDDALLLARSEARVRKLGATLQQTIVAALQ